MIIRIVLDQIFCLNESGTSEQLFCDHLAGTYIIYNVNDLRIGTTACVHVRRHRSTMITVLYADKNIRHHCIACCRRQHSDFRVHTHSLHEYRF